METSLITPSLLKISFPSFNNLEKWNKRYVPRIIRYNEKTLELNHFIRRSQIDNSYKSIDILVFFIVVHNK